MTVASECQNHAQYLVPLMSGAFALAGSFLGFKFSLQKHKHDRHFDLQMQHAASVVSLLSRLMSASQASQDSLTQKDEDAAQKFRTALKEIEEEYYQEIPFAEILFPPGVVKVLNTLTTRFSDGRELREEEYGALYGECEDAVIVIRNFLRP